MQVKSTRGPRGVQTEDVYAAADAVLAQGERPTIERIRHHLGRGSPNTVGPMLDGWFASLSARLQPPGETGEPGLTGDLALPAPVVRAARTLWGRALQLADEQAQARLASDRAELAAQTEALKVAQQELAQSERRLEEREQSLTLAFQAKDAQIAELGRQARDLQQQLGSASDLLENARADIAGLRQTVNAERAQSASKENEHRAERARLEERALSQERRLHAEVDRARQEVKRLTQQIDADAQKSAKALADALAHDRESTQQLGLLQAQNASLARELAMAREELSTLQSKSDEHGREMLDMLTELRNRLPAPAQSRSAGGSNVRTRKR